MKNHAIIFFTLAIFGLSGAMPSIEGILKTMELNYKMTTDASAKVSLIQQKVGQGVKNIELLWYRRDRDNAFLMVMAAPENEK